jgi:hypothetical protein
MAAVLQSRYVNPAFRRPGYIRCANLNKEMENVNMSLFLGIQKWLRIHGKVSPWLGLHSRNLSMGAAIE